MTCNNVQANLSAYVDEELSGAEMLEIRSHLSDCTLCSEEARAVEAIKKLVNCAPVPEPSADFEDRLVRNVLGASTAPTRQFSWLALAGLAAASMLVTFTVLQMFSHRTPAASEPTDSQAYQFIQRDRALAASNDPLNGSPIMPVSFESGR